MRSLLVAALLLAAVVLMAVALRGDPEIGPAADRVSESEVESGETAGVESVAWDAEPPSPAEAGTSAAGRRVAAQGSVRGQVLWTDGEPAVGARLSCTPRRRGTVDRRETVTDTDGHFVLDDLPSGSHRLHLYHPQATDDLTARAEIPVGEMLDLKVVHLLRGVPLAGLVVLVSGQLRQPAKEGWSVRAFSATGGSRITRIGPEGDFRFEALPPGIYEVVLWHRSWRTSPPVRASAGQHDVLLEAVRGEAVFTGEVTHPNGRPLQVFQLEVLDEGSMRPYARTSRSWGQGNYRTTPLPPGRYRLRFLAGGRHPREVRAILPEKGEVHIDVVLPEQRAVRGTVFDASGRELPGAHVTVIGEPTGHLAMDRLGLERLFDNIGGFTPGVFGNTDSEGHFSLPPQEGASWVLVRDIDHATRLVPVPPQDAGEIVVRLSKGVAVSGRVVDEHGRGLAGAQIMLFPDGVVLDPRALKEETDGGGNFTLAPVGPGTWSLLVLRDRSPLLRRPGEGPSFDRTFRVASTDVDLGDLR